MLRQWVQNDDGSWTAQVAHDDRFVDVSSEHVRLWPQYLDPVEAAVRPDQVVFRLRELLGSKLTAYVGGADDITVVADWANGRAVPEPNVAARLLAAYEAATLIEKRGDSADVIQVWFKGMNPELGDVAPARLLREAKSDRVEVAGRQVVEAASVYVSA